MQNRGQHTIDGFVMNLVGNKITQYKSQELFYTTQHPNPPARHATDPESALQLHTLDR